MGQAVLFLCLGCSNYYMAGTVHECGKPMMPLQFCSACSSYYTGDSHYCVSRRTMPLELRNESWIPWHRDVKRIADALERIAEAVEKKIPESQSSEAKR